MSREVLAALVELRGMANRLCDRGVGGTYEADCRQAIARADGAIREALARSPSSMADAAEMLWVVLANVSGGDWTQQTAEWQEAAARWRDNYFAAAGGPVARTQEDEMPNEPTRQEAETTSDGTKWLAIQEARDLIAAAIVAATAPLEDAIAALEGQVADLQQQLAGVQEELGTRVKYGEWVALRAAGAEANQQTGPFLSAEAGGPPVGDEFVLRGQAAAGAWESFAITRGAWQ